MGHQIRMLSLVLLTLLATNVQAIYKCTVNGKTVYSDMKCATDAEVINTDQSQRPSRTNTGSDYLTPGERMMLDNYDNRKPKRSTQSDSSDSIYGQNSDLCKTSKMYVEDYEDELRSGCRVSRCEQVKKEIRYWERRVDRYCN